MRLKESSRARGSTRGGCGGGGGYERLDPDFEIKRIKHIHSDYLALDKMWQEQFVRSLPKADQFALDRLLNPHKYA